MKRCVLILVIAGLASSLSAQTDRRQAIRISIMGDEYLKAGIFDQAIYYYQQAMDAYPELVKAQFQLAQCYRLSDQLDSAAYHYRSIIKQGQDFRYPMSRYHLAMMRLEQNEIQEAKEHLLTFRALMVEHKLSTLKKYVDFYEQAQEELEEIDLK